LEKKTVYKTILLASSTTLIVTSFIVFAFAESIRYPEDYYPYGCYAICHSPQDYFEKMLEGHTIHGLSCHRCHPELERVMLEHLEELKEKEFKLPEIPEKEIMQWKEARESWRFFGFILGIIGSVGIGLWVKVR